MTDRVRVLFCRSNNLGGWFIRAALMSDHNHVAIAIGDDVYDSTYNGGVRKTTYSRFKSEWNVDVVQPYAVEKVDSMVWFLESQLGAKYDWKAIVALPFKRDWYRSGKWICSELVAEAFIRAGYDFPITSNRVTPRDLRFILPHCHAVF